MIRIAELKLPLSAVEYHPENHAYRLLDARDGWNYLAVPLLAKEA